MHESQQNHHNNPKNASQNLQGEGQLFLVRTQNVALFHLPWETALGNSVFSSMCKISSEEKHREKDLIWVTLGNLIN